MTDTHALFQATSTIAAREHGVRPQEVLRTLKPGSFLKVQRARAEAVYLAAVSAGVGARRLACAAGVSHVAIIKMCRRVEDARDDPIVDARLCRLEQEIAA